MTLTLDLAPEVERALSDKAAGAGLPLTEYLRLVVVLSPAGLGRSTLRIVAPIIGWQPRFAVLPWMVELAPDAGNGLFKASGVDAAQLRAVDLERFGNHLGMLLPEDVSLVTFAAQLAIGAVTVPPATPQTPASGTDR